MTPKIKRFGFKMSVALVITVIIFAMIINIAKAEEEEVITEEEIIILGEEVPEGSTEIIIDGIQFEELITAIEFNNSNIRISTLVLFALLINQILISINFWVKGG